MSSTSSLVTARHFEYVAERTSGDDAFLSELKEAARGAGLPAIWISPEQASFMQVLLKGSGAREVVEVGTLGGYSAISMARALPAGGRVRTIEIVPAHAEFAATWAARSDVAERVEVLLGSGAEHLAAMEAASADACFIDADKEGYPLYLTEALRIVRPGGWILVDNAFAFGQLFDDVPEDSGVPAIRAFNDRMAQTAGVHGVICPLGDGLWVGVRE